jgi:hypothetical protein
MLALTSSNGSGSEATKHLCHDLDPLVGYRRCSENQSSIENKPWALVHSQAFPRQILCNVRVQMCNIGWICITVRRFACGCWNRLIVVPDA